MRVWLIEAAIDPIKRGERMELATHLLSQRLKKKHPGVEDITVSALGPRAIELGLLKVHRGQRKQGTGSRVMQDLVRFARRHKTRITLYPEKRNKEWGTTSQRRLQKFYKRFGFRKIRKSNWMDFDPS